VGQQLSEERTIMENHIEIEESNSKRDKGFTLVELLIVIVILGILATVTVFAVRGITDKGTKSACDSDKVTLQTAAESYFAQYGGTAIVVGTSNVLPGTTILAGATSEDTLVKAGYLRAASPKFDVTTAGGLTFQDAACGSTGTAVP
jgi:prepilin-type N-terminal cleavage/methylation domain-containing protein